MAKLKDGVALVTGGGQGMGHGIALRFAREGAKVVVVGRTQDKIDRTVAEIRDAGGTALACRADVSVEEDTRRMVEMAVSTYGRLDFAANVAGVAHAPNYMHKLTLQEYEDDFAVNARGVFLSMKYQIRAMLENGGGSIVNVTSGSAINGFAFFSAYSAAKHAALGLTRAAALEYADKGIRVNSVAPGAIATPMLTNNEESVLSPMRESIAMKRFGTEEEIAAATVWLCSEESSYVTGSVLPVEGGYTASCISIVSAVSYPSVV